MKRYHVLYRPSCLPLSPLDSHNVGSRIPVPPQLWVSGVSLTPLLPSLCSSVGDVFWRRHSS